jgi:hypothetical protein
MGGTSASCSLSHLAVRTLLRPHLDTAPAHHIPGVPSNRVHRTEAAVVLRQVTSCGTGLEVAEDRRAERTQRWRALRPVRRRGESRLSEADLRGCRRRNGLCTVQGGVRGSRDNVSLQRPLPSLISCCKWRAGSGYRCAMSVPLCHAASLYPATPLVWRGESGRR